MKITDVKAISVTVPMKAPLRWSLGVEVGTTRSLIEVHTDAGIVGIGETYGGPGTEHAIAVARPYLLGLDPLDTGVMHHRLSVFFTSYETTVPAVTRAGIEMACLDAAGKALNLPVYKLLGGATRLRIETSAYLFYRYRNAAGTVGGEATPEAMLDRTRRLVEDYGFRVIKFKGGVFAPDEEFRLVRLLRKEFPASPLRWDPNAAWSVETSIRTGQRLLAEGIDLEYLEDPTLNLEGMSQVRKAVAIPLATNMCLVAWEQLAPGIRARSVDVILSDVHFWGGFRQNQRMMAVAEAFQLGVGMHSDRELGISTAAMLHLAAASPYLRYAIDSHYHDQADDVITEPFVYEDGHFAVPAGAGLGVTLDPAKVEKYHRAYEEGGAVNEYYDPNRPQWVPAVPIF